MGKLTSKTKKMIAATTAFAMLAGVFSFGLTYNWFIEDNRTEVDMNGVVHGSYFESGSGTYEDPFEIARPVQLYYLSWLQEMGYFNQPEMDDDGHEASKAIRQFSFYLSQDLDMSEYTLPPIGTQTFPFVGEFNGKGHKIYNLTVDNDKSKLTDDPSSDAYNFQIIGLFGVIGSLDGQNANTVNGLPPEGDNAGLPTPGYTYDTSALSVKNFQIENTTIKTSTSNSLIGVAAGYVNGPLSNVGVNTSTITVGSGVSHLDGSLTNKISDYSIVGYCTNKYKEKLHIVDTTVYGTTGKSSTFVTTSQGNTWGGSIDMKTILQRTLKSRNLQGALTNSIPSYPTRETAIKYADGTVSNRVATQTSNLPGNYVNGQPSSGGDYSGTYYYHDDDVGSYYFANMSGTRSKAYIQGYTDVENGGSKLVDYYKYTSETETAYYLNTSDGYITVSSNGSLSYVLSTADSVKWHLDGQRHLFCLTVVNDYPGLYYLNSHSNGSIYISEEGLTTWTNNAGSFSCEFIPQQGDEQHNWYNGTTSGAVNIENCDSCELHAYRLDVATATSGWKNAGDKMKSTSTWAINGAIPAGTYKIYLSARVGEPNTDHGRQNLIENGVYKYYFKVDNGPAVDPTTTKTYAELGYDQEDHTSYGDMETTINITSSSSQFSLVYRSGGYSLRIDHVRLVPVGGNVDPIVVTLNKTSITDNKITSETIRERSGQAGYIPLAVNGSSTKFRDETPVYDDFVTSDKNTGYIVGGYYDETNGNDTVTSNRNVYRGDVRLADYAITDIQNCYENNEFKDLYTVKNGQRVQIDVSTYKNSTNSSNLEYKKLTNSLAELERNLKDQSNVSGIHFMDSVISMDHIITAPKVVLNKTTYTNFEMPEDSIDFTLKDKGYINFFAGNYQNDNNSFFTLNQIERDPSNHGKITGIKCISLIFSTNDISKPYIYKYTDGTYSDGLAHGSNETFTTTVNGDNCTYNVCFRTSDIGKNETAIPKGTTGPKNVYYFEIPVNSGEYALGSVPNACGGYLIYLDISAASQTIHRQTLSEVFVSTEEVYEHPLGVGYYDGNLGGTNPGSVNDRDSVAISLDDTASGDYTVSRTGSTINTGTNDTGADMGFRGDGLTTSPLTPNGKSTTTTRRRITDYDFNDITGIYVKQVTNVETVGNHNRVTINFSYNQITPTNTDDYTHVLTFSFEFDGTAPFYAYKYYFHESDNVVELMFQTNVAFDVNIENLASGYGVTTDGGTTIIKQVSSDPENPTTSHVATTNAYVADVWDAAGEGSFRFHYQYSDVDTVDVDYDFTFDSLNEPAGSGTGENQVKTITIVNGIYTITVTVTSGNENITVHTYNLGNNIVVGGTGTATVNVASGTASLTNKNVLAPTVNTVYSISTLSVGENKNKKTID